MSLNLNFKYLLLFIYSVIFLPKIASSKVNFQDSLYNVATNNKNPLNTRYSAFDRLIFLVRTNDDFSLCNKINQQYIDLGWENKDYTELTKAYMHRAMYYNNQSEYTAMQKAIDTATIYYKKSRSLIALVYLNYANIAKEVSFEHSGEAVKLSMQTIPIAEKYQLTFILSRIYNDLYIIYDEWKKSADALNYVKLSERYAILSNEINVILYSNSGKSDILENLITTTNKSVYVDSIFKLLNESFYLVQSFPDQVSNFSLSTLYESKAEYLLKYRLNEKDILTEIEKNINLSIQVCPKNQNNCLNILANDYILKSKIAHLHNQTKDEESYLLQAYEIQLKQEPTYFIDLNEYLNLIIEFYTRANNYNKAFDFQSKLLKLRDLQFDKEQSKIAQQYETQFESEKKDRRLKEFELNDDNRKKMRFLYLGLLILGIVGAYSIYKSIKLKLQVALAKQKQLQAEKLEQELQIKFEKEESQRLKTEQELLALQQQKLQSEVLANRLQLQHKNEVLKQIKENIQTDKSINIDKILREESLLDKDFESAVFQIEEVHPNFFKSLNDKSLQKLTPLDLKYCAYIYLGMNAKQIGNLLNVESKSVRMTKYRLKQKIGFPTEISLEDYLQSIAN